MELSGSAVMLCSASAGGLPGVGQYQEEPSTFFPLVWCSKRGCSCLGACKPEVPGRAWKAALEHRPVGVATAAGRLGRRPWP